VLNYEAGGDENKLQAILEARAKQKLPLGAMTLPWASCRTRATIVSARWNNISKTLTQMKPGKKTVLSAVAWSYNLL
jgi:hypothetical protein